MVSVCFVLYCSRCSLLPVVVLHCIVGVVYYGVLLYCIVHRDVFPQLYGSCVM